MREMSENSEAAARYRQRAERLRAIAAEDGRPENRELLISVANDYERTARDLEAMDQLTRSISKS
jgi:hypothetical protein